MGPRLANAMPEAPVPAPEEASAARRALAWRRPLLAHAPDALFALDGDGRLLEANQAFARLLGRILDDAMALRLWDWDVDFPEARAREMLQRDAPEEASFESHWRRADGQLRLMETRIHRLRDAHGRLTVGSSRDITDRQLTETALRASEARLALALQASGTGVWEWDLDNAHLCEITGYSRETLMALDFRLLTHPEDRRDEWPQLRQVLRGKLPFFRREKRYLRHDGSSIWVAASSAVVGDGNHRGLHSVTVVEDITERVHVAAELAQHRQHLDAEAAEVAERTQALQQAMHARSDGEHFLRSIADNTPDMVGDWDASRVLRFASRPYRDWFAPGQDPVGRSRAEFFGAPDTDAGEQAFAAAIGRPCPAL